MKYRIVIDIDGKYTWKTIVVTMTNTVENPNIYNMCTTITDNHETIEVNEIKGHRETLEYILSLKRNPYIDSKDCCGFDIYHKQTFITEKNPYISKLEYIKRFLWE